ncbi:MAG: PD-(D/E)XK nuclease family protein [Sphaerochaetaceae bacterium]|nr:PD-(D/E)XK nuclease family protein [Sphaerochaetaceae bacterium]
MKLTSYEQLHEAVFSSIARENSICVFPDETVRRSWIQQYTLKSEKGALLLNRILSWDTFIRNFQDVKDLKEADETVRFLFVKDLIEKNGSSLRFFCQSGYPQLQSNLIPTIVSLFSHFPSLRRAKEEMADTYSSLPSSYRHDIELIEAGYLEFLRDHRLWDPLCIVPCECHDEDICKSSVHIFFPRLCTSFSEYRKVISFLPSVQLYEVSSIQTQKIVRYPNEKIELASVLQKVKELLQSGVHHDDIAVTAGPAQRMREYLYLEAKKIPLSVRIVYGKPILDTAVGRLFDSMQKVSRGNFDIDVVRPFLLDRTIPWRYRDLHEKIVRLGLKYHIHQRGPYSKNNAWKSVLHDSPCADRRLYYYVNRLFQIIFSLVNSKDISEIIRYVSILRSKFFEEGRWSYETGKEVQSGENQAFTFCLEQLSSLSSSLSLFSDTENLRPYPLFLQLLRTRRFNAAGADEGVRVYEYGHSAGITARYHFFIGCNGEVVDKNRRMLPLLKIDSFEESAADELLRTCMASGEYVTFSCSSKGYGNTTNTIPHLFFEKNMVIKGEGERNRLMIDEMTAWRDGRKEKKTLFSAMQQRGYLYAKKTVFRDRGIDLSIQKRSISLVPYAADTDGRIPFSSSSIDMFTACPMKYVSSRVFSVRKEDYAEILIDHGEIGNLEHNIYSRFFREFHTLYGTFEVEQKEKMRALLTEICDREVNRRLVAAARLESHIVRYIQQRYLSLLPAIIDEELKQFCSNETVEVELPLNYVDEDGKFILDGRIDRVIRRSDGSLCVIDYKKSRTISKKEFTADARSLSSYQLPLYVLLLEKNGRKAECAAYYNIEGKRYLIAFSDDQELTDSLVKLSLSHIADIIDRIESGTMGATPSKKVCGNCDYRQVCRRRYSLP